MSLLSSISVPSTPLYRGKGNVKMVSGKNLCVESEFLVRPYAFDISSAWGVSGLDVDSQPRLEPRMIGLADI